MGPRHVQTSLTDLGWRRRHQRVSRSGGCVRDRATRCCIQPARRGGFSEATHSKVDHTGSRPSSISACSLSWMCKFRPFRSLSLSTLCCTVASIRSRLVQILHEGTDAVSHHGFVWIADRPDQLYRPASFSSPEPMCVRNQIVAYARVDE